MPKSIELLCDFTEVERSELICPLASRNIYQDAIPMSNTGKMAPEFTDDSIREAASMANYLKTTSLIQQLKAAVKSIRSSKLPNEDRQSCLSTVLQIIKNIDRIHNTLSS